MDGFSDDGYSGMSSRAESPVSLHGLSSRNTTARGSSPRPKPQPEVTLRTAVNTGLMNKPQSDNKVIEKTDTNITKQSGPDKKRINFCPCMSDPSKKKSTKQGKIALFTRSRIVLSYDMTKI